MDCILVRGFILDSFVTRHRSVHQQVRVKYFASYLIIITIGGLFQFQTKNLASFTKANTGQVP